VTDQSGDDMIFLPLLKVEEGNQRLMVGRDGSGNCLIIGREDVTMIDEEDDPLSVYMPAEDAVAFAKFLRNGPSSGEDGVMVYEAGGHSFLVESINDRITRVGMCGETVWKFEKVVAVLEREMTNFLVAWLNGENLSKH